MAFRYSGTWLTVARLPPLETIDLMAGGTWPHQKRIACGHGSLASRVCLPKDGTGFACHTHEEEDLPLQRSRGWLCLEKVDLFVMGSYSAQIGGVDNNSSQHGGKCRQDRRLSRADGIVSCETPGTTGIHRSGQTQ